jgi:cation:H+ antiporter
MFNFSSCDLTTNLWIFAAAAGAVWIAGTKLIVYADELAERFNLSRAVLGLLLLASMTSLPEIAAGVTAARSGYPELSVNNLLGAIALQITLLAVADMIIDEQALTSIIPNPMVMLQGAFNVCLLAFVTIIALVGDVPLLGAGVGSWLVFALAIYSFIKVRETDRHYPWLANDPDTDNLDQEYSPDAGERERPLEDDSSAWLMIKTLLSGLTILLAGYVVASVGDAIAKQTGLGDSFIGFTLVSVATSLPEASTVFAGVRRRLYTMAISEILGTTTFNVALLLGVDALADGGPVLSRVGHFTAIGALLGLAATGMLLVGLLERANRTFLRMGIDSWAILAAYSSGMFLLYSMRES